MSETSPTERETVEDKTLAADRTRARRRGDPNRVTLADLRAHAGIQLHHDDWDTATAWLRTGNALEIAGCDHTHELVAYLADKGNCTRIAHTRQLTLDQAAAIRDDTQGSILLAGTGGIEFDNARVTLFARRNNITRTDAADWLATIATQRIVVPAIVAAGSTPTGTYGPTSYAQFSTRRTINLVHYGE